MKFGNRIVTDGLVFAVDAANPTSFVSGSTAWNDLTPTKNNGTLINGPTFNPANAGSIEFDGIDDYVSVPNSSELTFTDGAGNDKPFTIAFWIKTDDLRNGIIIQKTNEFKIAGNNSRQYYIILYTDASNRVGGRKVSGILYIANKWQYLTYTYDGQGISTGTNSMKIYIDGDFTAITSASTLGTYAGMTNTGNPIEIGDNTEMNLSCVTFYNRVLSELEVLQNYNALKGRFGL